MATLFDKDFELTPEQLAAELGTKKAIEAATPPKTPFLEGLIKAYQSAPIPASTQFAPVYPKVEVPPAASPLDGGYSPVPENMSVGEPARGAPVAKPAAPIRGVSSKPMQASPLAKTPEILSDSASVDPGHQNPAPAPAAPAAPAAPQTDDEMKAAQDIVRQRKLLGMIPQFLSGFASNGEELRKGIDTAVNSPVADLLMRRKALAEKVKTQREDEEYARKKSLDDLTSKPSQVAQMIAIHRGIPPEMAKQLPASALAEVLNSENSLDAAKNQIAMRDQAKADLAERERASKANNATQWGIAKLNNATELEKAGMKGGKQNTSEQISVPGTPIAPGWVSSDIPIKTQEAADFRAAVASKNTLLKQAQRLDELIAKHGTETANTDVKREMGDIVGSMRAHIKDLNKLGAISAYDADQIMNNQIPDPRGVAPEWFVNNRGTLKALKSDVERKFDEHRKSKGIVPDSRGGESAGSDVSAYQTPAAHDAAMKWAQANPNDPDAQKIMALNRGQ